ncbi:hypothetical protein M9Y10_002361 [Tritrichomonas musculus]|mgnify:CR=1 FL=1|uniref:Uncharacterized protein n=1 Tax=Tritrichomonas musculus TaxID=1915356 RepID=A0ABR2GM90_9EUKA
MSDPQDNSNLHQEKSSRVMQATDYMLEIIQHQTEHVFLCPGVITPYDAYAVFIDTCKKNIQPELIHHLIHGSDYNMPIEQILTPSYVCSLAYTHLKKILDINESK